jgi:hypothetical protein
VIEAETGIVLNIIDASQDFVLDGAPLMPDDGQAVIGGSCASAAFQPPVPETEPEPVPATISFRQLILGLLGSGFLAAEQALVAAETCARPPQLEAILADLPGNTELAARITWATMSEARRADPLFAALIAARHATADQVDELFRQGKML